MAISSSNNNTDGTLSDDEIEVANVLLDLPYLITNTLSSYRFPYDWGSKKRRSALVFPPSYSPPRCRRKVSAQLPPPVKAEASSPNTPLSFSPSESDSKSVIDLDFKKKKHPPLNLRKKELEDSVKEKMVTQQRLKESVDKVREYRNSLMVENSILKARKHELVMPACTTTTRMEQQQHQQITTTVVNDRVHAIPSRGGLGLRPGGSSDSPGPKKNFKLFLKKKKKKKKISVFPNHEVSSSPSILASSVLLFAISHFRLFPSEFGLQSFINHQSSPRLQLQFSTPVLHFFIKDSKTNSLFCCAGCAAGCSAARLVASISACRLRHGSLASRKFLGPPLIPSTSSEYHHQPPLIPSYDQRPPLISPVFQSNGGGGSNDWVHASPLHHQLNTGNNWGIQFQQYHNQSQPLILNHHGMVNDPVYAVAASGAMQMHYPAPLIPHHQNQRLIPDLNMEYKDQDQVCRERRAARLHANKEKRPRVNPAVK